MLQLLSTLMQLVLLILCIPLDIHMGEGDGTVPVLACNLIIYIMYI